MKIVVFEPNKRGYIKEIPNTLEAMQEVVGGKIEVVHLTTDVIAVCNEEGRILGLPNNRCGLVGTFFCCGEDGEDFTSLSEGTKQRLISFMGGIGGD